MREIIVITKEHLRQIIEDVIESAVFKLKQVKVNPEKSEFRFLNVKQAAEITGLAIQTIYEKTSRNLIPYHKKGRRLYFIKQELEQWIMEGNNK